ncbi:MAG: hypothetical protein LUH58_05140 [Lachnospiraceae bacterium]|nr:hypothetical protein [Lachnospiraceae bacterium]
MTAIKPSLRYNTKDNVQKRRPDILHDEGVKLKCTRKILQKKPEYTKGLCLQENEKDGSTEDSPRGKDTVDKNILRNKFKIYKRTPATGHRE